MSNAGEACGAGATAARIAGELEQARAALLEAVAGLSETRVYARTEREGWTLKHELARLSAGDDELLHVLGRASDDGGSEPLRVSLRRLRGESMHRAQELRLGPLREHLHSGGERAAAALRGYAGDLERQVELDVDAATTVLGLAEAHVARTREAEVRVQRVLGD